MDSAAVAAEAMRFPRRLTNNQLNRMSMSLQEVIREIEEEADDQVLVPRSPKPGNMNGTDNYNAFAVTTDEVRSNACKLRFTLLMKTFNFTG